jgi:SOS-response transcriptional repressor LexA
MRSQSAICLEHIARLTVGGVAPSYDQIKDAMGLKSKGNIVRMVDQLERDGFIRRRPGCPRSIEIIKVPDLKEHLRVLVETHGFMAIDDALAELGHQPFAPRGMKS